MLHAKSHLIFVVLYVIFFSDGINKLYILRNQGVELISSLLSSEDEDILLGVITTLMFLITPESVNEITSPRIIKRMLEFSDPSYEHRRIKNVATLFLNDFCETSAIEKVKTENQSV